MSWTILIHPPSDFVALNVGGNTKRVYLDIRKKIDHFLESRHLTDGSMLQVIDAFNETKNVAGGFDESIPLCKLVFKYLRYRLCDNSHSGFYRITHLLNGMMRNCGIRAHVLIGRLLFLQTMAYRAVSFKKKSPESAQFGYRCIREWATALEERGDLFPHYQKVLKELKKAGFEDTDQKFGVTNSELMPIEMDPHYKLMQFGTMMNAGDFEEAEEGSFTPPEYHMSGKFESPAPIEGTIAIRENA
jgi:hypothetical protein